MKVKSDQGKTFKRWAMLLLLLPLLSACSRGGSGDQKLAEAIDPPPMEIEQVMLQDTVETTISEGNDVVTVYLLDRNDFLAPMSLRLDTEHSSSLTSAEKAIAWMTVNEQLADQLPAGFTAILPKGTAVSSINENLSDETISVDFAAPFSGIIASHERKVIEALVWTLTELPGINKVKLSVAGKPIQSLPSSGLPIDKTLTRGLGINLEMTKDIQLNRAMGVTLYFSSQSEDGEGYFVPVTRLINRQANPAKAALEQLIIGPKKGALKAVLTTDMTIEKVSQMADTINVSLQDSDWMPKSPVPSEMMEAIVLTLTEATGAPQVQVMMNGNDSLVDSDQRTYDRPVTRPAYVNTLSR
ncbi:GerMN domain-containing protein [Cohnella sp. WQ 127256]|uniref:GerMN domain-containing protein n=1 Tax=Cohnella sp. WQ 127256 TaxID=2938790 RepID=UPI002117EC27|nr:GerMN domain-containing protein [Cohnella sp. WQ 127256]